MATSTVPPGSDLPSARVPRVAVVTGGTSDLTTEVADRLRELPLDVAVLDCAAKPEAVEAALVEVAATRGEPSVLVNVVHPTAEGPLCTLSDAQWETATGTPLRDVFAASRSAADSMSEAGWGRIVTVAPPLTHGSEHAALRAGLEGFTRTIALELEPFGVTANLIAPRRPHAGIGAGPGPGHVSDPARDDAARYARAVRDAVAALLGAGSVTGQVVYVSTDATD
jgi:3-oxoacyl-[acyl-carrier protein] reductase